MGILDKIFKAQKSGDSGDANHSSEKVQGQYFDTILGDRDLYERVAALCSMDILEYLIPFSALDDGYTYSIDGTVFAKDGCGGHYALLCDGSIGYINFSENECGRAADSVKDLLELELNCASAWHNYLDIKYWKNPSLLKEDVPALESEGREQFEDAYGNEMPGYADLQKEIAAELDLDISVDITKDVLPKLYQSLQKQPEFIAVSRKDHIALGKLYK